MRAACLAFLLGAPITTACKNSSFTSGGIPTATGDGNAQRALNERDEQSGFAVAGKTLDLYLIMDNSGSLYVDPQNQRAGSGSDVECKRFDAVLDLVDSLRTKLKSSEEVRMTVVTFGKSALRLGTIDKLLSQSKEALRAQFRSGVCNSSSLETTNYERGISVALQSHDQNVSQKKLDLKSVVFFSDGAAKDRDTQALEASIERLNQTFKSRVYGVLLGRTTDKCVLRGPQGQNLQTKECMLKVVGNDTDKLLNVNDASGLSAAWANLVNK